MKNDKDLIWEAYTSGRSQYKIVTSAVSRGEFDIISIEDVEVGSQEEAIQKAKSDNLRDVLADIDPSEKDMAMQEYEEFFKDSRIQNEELAIVSAGEEGVKVIVSSGYRLFNDLNESGLQKPGVYKQFVSDVNDIQW